MVPKFTFAKGIRDERLWVHWVRGYRSSDLGPSFPSGARDPHERMFTLSPTGTHADLQPDRNSVRGRFPTVTGSDTNLLSGLK